jgi:uncharacterized protein (TIGR03435 family)
MRRITMAALFVSAVAVPLVAQTAAGPRFEVASVKRAATQYGGGPRPVSSITLSTVRVLPGGAIESRGQSLRNLILWAYEVGGIYRQVLGDQEVLATEFEIDARAASPAPSIPEVRAMLRTLLEERFQLRTRLQPKEIDAYALMPAREDGRPGAALRPFTGDCAARPTAVGVRFEDPAYEERARCGMTGINGRQRAVGLSMATLAERLTTMMLAPVSDKTSWPGLFNFDVMADTSGMPIESRLPMPAGLGARVPVDAPALLDVLRTDLGLRLVKERTTVSDLVVERVEPLIEN